MKCYLIGLLSMLSVHAAMGQQAIDVHCHNILPTFKELLDRHGATLEETFPLPDWDVASHLKFMKEAGIETSVLSMPAFLPTVVRRCGRESSCGQAIQRDVLPAESGLSRQIPLLCFIAPARCGRGYQGSGLCTRHARRGRHQAGYQQPGTVCGRCGTRYADASSERAPCRRDAASAQTFARKRWNHCNSTASRLRISGRDDPYRRQSDCEKCSGPVSESEVRRTALRFISAAGPSAHEGGISGHGGERAYGTD